MSLWKRTMDYLGLGPDDAYDDYDDYDEPEPAPRPRRASHEPEAKQGRGYPEHETEGVVRTVPVAPDVPDPRLRSLAGAPSSRPPTSRASSPGRAGGSSGGGSTRRSGHAIG